MNKGPKTLHSGSMETLTPSIRGQVRGQVCLSPFLSAECNQHLKEGQDTQVCDSLISGRVAETLVDCCRWPQNNIGSDTLAELLKNRRKRKKT